MPVDPLEWYSRRDVAEEVAAFLKGRWAALEGPGKRFIRWLGDRPLVVRSPSDVPALVRRFREYNVRTFYGTIEVFKRLEGRRDVEEDYDSNVEKATVFIDVDVTVEERLGEAWRSAIKAATLIGEWFEGRLGTSRGIYLLWSGAGVHVRLHEDLFCESRGEEHPLDVAFAVAEYALEVLEPQLWEVVRESQGLVKIENLVAPKRVFTAPLSLHRRLDRVAVAFTLDEAQSFTLEWSEPGSYRHNPEAWRRVDRCAGDELAREALARIGRVKRRTLMEARAAKLGVPPAPGKSIARLPLKPLKEDELLKVLEHVREPGRFPVMGLLQAARYYLLRGDLERAKSWGLNRAIFYAWAKYYGPARRGRRVAEAARRYSSGRRVSEEELKWEEVGGEKAQVSPRGWYVIGGVEQTPEDFDRNIARRFEEAGIPFEIAWEAALEYLRKFPRTALTNPQRFFKEVYEPVRDRFVERVLLPYLRRRLAGRGGEGGGGEGATLDRWLRKT